MIKAIAFDPGITTGFATGELENANLECNCNIPELEGAGQHSIGCDVFKNSAMQVQTAQAKMSVSEVFNYLNDFRPDYLIYESFEFRNKARTGLEMFSRELIGVFELYFQTNNDITIIKQSPGHVINGFFKPDRLRTNGIYRKGQIHANEAASHLLYWYTFGSGFKYNHNGYVLKDK